MKFLDQKHSLLILDWLYIFKPICNYHKLYYKLNFLKRNRKNVTLCKWKYSSNHLVLHEKYENHYEIFMSSHNYALDEYKSKI